MNEPSQKKISGCEKKIIRETTEASSHVHFHGSQIFFMRFPNSRSTNRQRRRRRDVFVLDVVYVF